MMKDHDRKEGHDMENELNVAGPICMSPHSMRHKQPMTSMREGVWCMVDETGGGANWLLDISQCSVASWIQDSTAGTTADLLRWTGGDPESGQA